MKYDWQDTLEWAAIVGMIILGVYCIVDGLYILLEP